MSKPETIKINDVQYVRKDAAHDTKGDVKIVVLDRGFVYVGRIDPKQPVSDLLVIQNAKCIRKWGTTKGLGELVNGPTEDTVTDAVGTVSAPWRAVIHLIDVVASKWTGI